MGFLRWRATKTAHYGRYGDDTQAGKKWLQPAKEENGHVAANSIIVEVTMELGMCQTEGKRDKAAKEIARHPQQANDKEEPNDTVANPTLAENKKGCRNHER